MHVFVYHCQCVFHMHTVYMSLLWHWYDTCHMLHDISNQEAQTAWDMALENPDIFKSGEGKNKRVAVHGIPTIEGLRAKTFQREVAHESALGEHGLMESALGRLDFASQGVDMTHDFGGLMGDVFRPGAAIGNSSVMAVMAANGHDATAKVTPEQVAVMPLRYGAAPSTPAPALHDRTEAPVMSPRSARIGVMLDISIVLMPRSVDFGLYMYARVDAHIRLWHVLA